MQKRNHGCPNAVWNFKNTDLLDLSLVIFFIFKYAHSVFKYVFAIFMWCSLKPITNADKQTDSVNPIIGKIATF